MKRGMIILIGIAGCIAAAGAVEFHVAPNGDNANAGSLEAPWATLEGARDALRAMKDASSLPQGGVTVWLHAGTYRPAAGFQLEERDSGAPDARVTYRAAAGEEVRVTGGIEVPADAFTPLSDAGLVQRIDPGAVPYILQADLKALGVTDYGAFPDTYQEPPVLPELFFNGQRMTLARWPNEGWAEVAKVIESGPAPWRNHASELPGTFEYAGDRPSRWLQAPGVWLHGYWCFDWRAETIRVKEINPENHSITFVAPHCYGLGGGNPAPRRYCAINLIEELDMPGEYYLDRESGLLYFWPPAPLAGARAVFSVLRDPVISLNACSHVTIQGLIIEACCGEGIHVSEGQDNHILACTVRNTGQSGIVVTGGTRHRVAACDIHEIGTAGLCIEGGDRATLTPCGHEAVNNHIHHVSLRQRTGAYNVHVRGVGVRIAHNALHHAPHQAIGLGGNNHIIEFNEIHHAGLESDDCGSFYMGRNPSERGSILRYNFWHHTGSQFSHGSCAVYFDDGSGGQHVFGNVFYKAAGGHFGAVFVHGGHQNTVENNIFVDCKLAFRQAPWSDGLWRQHLDEDDYRTKLLTDVDITKPPYSVAYPDLKGFMEFAGEPRLNYAYRNVAVNCGELAQGNWLLLDNLVLHEYDPGFVDAAAMNFQLKDDSVLYRQIPGFQPIPFNRIGLVQDDLRPVLPARDMSE